MTLLSMAAPPTVSAVAARTASARHAAGLPQSSSAASTVTRKSATMRGCAALT